jgi:cytochrome P450
VQQAIMRESETSRDIADTIIQSLLTADGRRNPYPLYADLRRAASVAYSEVTQSYLVTSHRHARDVLRHPSLGKHFEERLRVTGAWDRVDGSLSTSLKLQMLVNLDPPDHTRIRNAVADVFTPESVEALRPAVDATVRDLLQGLRPGDEIDLIHCFAQPLPVKAICDLLGVPRDDSQRLETWAAAGAATSGPIVDDATFRRGEEAAIGFVQYFTDLIEQRMRDPQGDVLSKLVHLQKSCPEELSRDELVSTLTMLFIAGFETTMNLIGNGLYGLLEQRRSLERLRSDPRLDRISVEELLRWDSPIQYTTRVSSEPVTIGDVSIPAGEAILCLLGAANRDPERFSDPDRIDFDRRPGGVLAFGGGIHYCLGAALGRLEAAVALPALIRSFPGLELAGEPVWRQNLVFRGLARLPVRLGS